LRSAESWRARADENASAGCGPDHNDFRRWRNATEKAVPRALPAGDISALRFAPGKAARVSLELVVPRRAKPGKYLSDIVVSSSAAAQAGTGNLGVAAATKLEFSVSSAPAQGASSFPVWMWWALTGLLLLLTLTVFGVRRSGLRIRVEWGSSHRDGVDHQGESHG